MALPHLFFISQGYATQSIGNNYLQRETLMILHVIVGWFCIGLCKWILSPIMLLQNIAKWLITRGRNNKADLINEHGNKNELVPILFSIRLLKDFKNWLNLLNLLTEWLECHNIPKPGQECLPRATIKTPHSFSSEH